jgi:hypothetical protein
MNKSQIPVEDKKWLIQFRTSEEKGPLPEAAVARFFGSEILPVLQNAESKAQNCGYDCVLDYGGSYSDNFSTQLQIKKDEAVDFIRFETTDFIELNISFSGKGTGQTQAVFSMKRFIDDPDTSFIEGYVNDFLVQRGLR